MKFYTTAKISENMHETPEGYLVCVGVPIARTGDMVYGPGETPLEVGPDNTVTISRDEDEVFRAETIASFAGKPVTIGHPNDFVAPESWNNLSKGIIQHPRRGEDDHKDDLIADLLITDRFAIDLVKSGLREVSCGYEAKYTQTGIGRGTQKHIIGNHLALVDEGRAGSSYAINDHKRRSQMSVKDKIKAIFAKAQAEALEVAETTDAAPTPTPTKDKDGISLDDVVKAVKDLEALVKPKEPAKDAPGDPPAAQTPANTGNEFESRLAKLEQMVAQIVEKLNDDKDEDEEEDDDETRDTEEAEDEMPASTLTGDTASRVEILSPGMNPKQKGIKVKALKAAYATSDGKAVIDQFTGGKAPDYKNAKFVDTVFIAASEVIKVNRNSELSKTKTRDNVRNIFEGEMTPEKINEINQKHYANRK